MPDKLRLKSIAALNQKLVPAKAGKRNHFKDCYL